MTAAPVTFLQFLRDRVDEDGQIARAATPGPWTLYDTAYPETIYGDGDKTAVVAGGRWGGEASVFESTADAIHIARHDPARVLADVDAKRRIIAVHVDRAECTRCERFDGEFYPCETLRLLALPYRQHAAYRPEFGV